MVVFIIIPYFHYLFLSPEKFFTMELKTIQSCMYEIRGVKVMLDYDLADLYEVPTKALNQAVKRNPTRFPPDFMFQLNDNEWATLQTALKTKHPMRSQIVTTSGKFRRKGLLPYVFTEQGVSMLSSVLRSEKAIHVNIAIMRAFVFMRQYALSHDDLAIQLKELEEKYDRQFKDVYAALQYLMMKDVIKQIEPPRKEIGFKQKIENE